MGGFIPSGPELIVVLIVVMLIFGVGKLPEVGAGLGRGIREFKDQISGRDSEDKKQLNSTTSATARPVQSEKTTETTAATARPVESETVVERREV